MLPNGVSEVTVASKDAGWFAMNRTYPVLVSIDARQDVARIGDTVFRLYKAEDGGYHVSRREGGTTSVLGTVDARGLRRSTSNAARRDLQALRAAIYDVDYAAPIAYVIKNGATIAFVRSACLASPGDEAGTAIGVGPITVSGTTLSFALTGGDLVTEHAGAVLGTINAPIGIWVTWVETAPA